MDECVGNKRSFAPRLYYDPFVDEDEEEFGRPKKKKIDLTLKFSNCGKRFGLTKAQMKGCRSLHQLAEKIIYEGKHEFMVFLLLASQVNH